MAVLLPWRHKVNTDEGRTLFYPFLKAYVVLGDLKGYLGLTEEKYNVLSASKTTSITSHDVLRYATALYVNGKKEQAWLLCQKHTDLFTENFYDSRLKEYKDRQVTPANLGDALLRGSARLDSSLSMYFFQLLVSERPNDAGAHFSLARSMPYEDFLGRKFHYERAKALGDAEMQKKAEKELKAIYSILNSPSRRRGGGSTAFSLSGQG